ncbi:lytic transglycosylase domain-containing protein [Paracoccus sp. pheM1]|uniref:lytic transglycosylase domain-containing protein n=1 Tax=Paracoccus sp. pheM1 TaxID=2831675 RepID=UPI001BDB7C95|nr:lytic transglycosylase domain-containing protein [Paracoccus sp. pheM1]MBT0779203.1 lytic transglycosylase domain-containing protein [Paracoccus sp. pheM1]
MPFLVPHRANGRACAARRAAILLLSGLAFAALPAAGPLAQTVQPVVRESRDPFASHVAEASLRFGIPPDWIRAVRHVESGGNPHAVSPKGAMGLMQVMPKTWAALRARHALGDDPFDPRDNIFAGAAYLREMHDRYGSIAGMLAAYNAGPGRYDEHLVSGRTLPAETRAYVATLAPMLGGETLPGSGFAAVPSRDWREAPLFTGSMAGGSDAERLQPTSTSAASSMPPDSPSLDASDVQPAGDGSGLSPQSSGLFIRRSDAGVVQ